tara:strand:+ start:349 stop:1068 length:720 start_codon:yes stop_codon:yes gene_type:complete
MIKKDLNQNDIYVHELIDTIEPNFVFNDKPINRFKITEDKKNNLSRDKQEKLLNLRDQINSIENCNIRNGSKDAFMGNGNINSKIMLIGEAPDQIKSSSDQSYQDEVSSLLKKMLLAINIEIEKIYLTYAINFKIPENRRPNTSEIKRYSTFLKEHISIINPEIVVLMGSTAMEAVTGLSKGISSERGKWKEIIIKNKTFSLMVTFSPSYLIRFPDNKKFSWEDLKIIKKKILDFSIKV